MASLFTHLIWLEQIIKHQTGELSQTPECSKTCLVIASYIMLMNQRLLYFQHDKNNFNCNPSPSISTPFQSQELKISHQKLRSRSKPEKITILWQTLYLSQEAQLLSAIRQTLYCIHLSSSIACFLAFYLFFKWCYSHSNPVAINYPSIMHHTLLMGVQ